MAAFEVLNSCFQRNLEQKPVRLSRRNTRFSRKKRYFLPKKSKSKRRSCFIKEELQRPAQVFSYYCYKKFLKTPILKNICKLLLLKISTPASSLPQGGISWFYYLFKTLVSKILLMLLLCNMPSKLNDIFIIKHASNECYHFFIIQIITESVNLIKM